jgi:flagellar basal body-associated protein FliL
VTDNRTTVLLIIVIIFLIMVAGCIIYMCFKKTKVERDDEEDADKK